MIEALNASFYLCTDSGTSRNDIAMQTMLIDLTSPCSSVSGCVDRDTAILVFWIHPAVASPEIRGLPP